MRHKKFILTLIEIVIVLVTALAFLQYTKSQIKPVTVYKYNKTLKSNQLVTEEDITEKEIPSDALTPNYRLSKNDIIGKCVNTTVYANEYVSSMQLSSKEEANIYADMDLSNYRLITIPVDASSAHGGNIRVGDRVDLVYVSKAENKKSDSGEMVNDFYYSKTIMQNILVDKVLTEDGYKYVDRTNSAKGETESEGEEYSDPSSTVGLITLAVTLDQFEELSARLAQGTITIAQRFSGENGSKNVTSSGYTINSFSNVYTGAGNPEVNN